MKGEIMRIDFCPKCNEETYHFILLTYCGTGIEVITIICSLALNGEEGCYQCTTLCVPVGTWYLTVTGGVL